MSESHPEIDVDDIAINPSHEPWLRQLAGRRQILKGGLGLALAGFLGAAPARAVEKVAGPTLKKTPGPLIGFTSVDLQLADDFDRVLVPEGYSARAFFSWGDPVVEGAVPWRADASNSWQEQALQAGDNNDGMAYFPFADSPDSHGLLVVNHEYTNPTLHPHGPTEIRDAQGFIHRPLDEVKKEQMAHGVSVIEIKKDARGDWQRVTRSAYNRRLHLHTPMQITGPAAGSDLLKTQADPSGLQVLGTLNNCSMGRTPWGTYLVCEENWHNYFVNRDQDDYAKRKSHKRNGISNQKNSSKYYWESVDPRFNATPDASQVYGGYVNEPNRFGWVVEFDPFDPASTPKKRTAMGRYSRECATLFLASNGQMAFYSGDDTRGEYIYKFVPRHRYLKDATPPRDILDEGVLYVARFNEDGTGKWLPLVWGEGGLTVRNGFASQAEVLVNARAAADILGATPMDRPEWVAVDPHNHHIYASLTNNIERGNKPDQPLCASNPRGENHHGHIIRWRERNNDPAATEFTWDIFLLAGKGEEGPENERNTIRGDIFSCPDGLWFDGDGRLWIETDFDDDQPAYASMGTNQLLCANPETRDVRRFLVGPRGCEITGLTGTPDGKSLWLNIQHPQLSYPASDGKTRPRATTVLITKNDGGVIGS